MCVVKSSVFVTDFYQFIGKVTEWFFDRKKEDEKIVGYTRTNFYEFDCGQIYKITVERVK